MWFSRRHGHYVAGWVAVVPREPGVSDFFQAAFLNSYRDRDPALLIKPIRRLMGGSA